MNVAARCPACNAALRADAQWCSLCHHDLRPAPVAPPVQVPAPSQPAYGGSASPSDPLTAPLLDLVLPPVPQAAVVAPHVPAAVVPQQAPSVQEAAQEAAQEAVQEALQEWPCTSCGARNPISLMLCSACGSKFLASASTPVSLVVPGVGDLQQLSRGQRIAVAGGFLALVLVPLAALTFFLTSSPTKAAPTNGPTETTVTTITP